MTLQDYAKWAGYKQDQSGYIFKKKDSLEDYARWGKHTRQEKELISESRYYHIICALVESTRELSVAQLVDITKESIVTVYHAVSYMKRRGLQVDVKYINGNAYYSSNAIIN